MTAWKNRIIKTADVPPADLVAHPMNWRDHPHSQDTVLGQSLDSLGWIKRILVNANTGHIIDGHLRVDRAMREGAETVPVAYLDLTENEERIALAVLDPIANAAATDADKLAELYEIDLDAATATLVAAMSRIHSGQANPTPQGAIAAPGAPQGLTCPRCQAEIEPSKEVSQ